MLNLGLSKMLLSERNGIKSPSRVKQDRISPGEGFTEAMTLDLALGG